MIAICSYFRDSQNWHGFNINQVNKFFSSITNQENIDKNDLVFFLLEGNSKDNTKEVIKSYQDKLNINLLEEQSTTNVGSIVSQERFKNLSRIGNLVLNKAKELNPKYILWMESDLVPPPNMLSELLSWTKEHSWNKTFCISPVPTFDINGQHQFYDTWAFEGSGGEKWNNLDLFKILSSKQRLRPMRSIGSCALINGELLTKYNLDFGEGCFPELCHQARTFGLSIYCDTSVKISHPSLNYISNRLI